MNNWSESKLNRLKQWIEISQIYSICHSKTCEYYSSRFNQATISVIFLSAMATVLEGANLLADNPSMGLGISVIVCTSLASALNLWLNSKNPTELASAHENMSKGYNRIILKIESELANDDNERTNGVKFINEIRDNLTDLSTGSNTIPSFIWKKVNSDLRSDSQPQNQILNQELDKPERPQQPQSQQPQSQQPQSQQSQQIIKPIRTKSYSETDLTQSQLEEPNKETTVISMDKVNSNEEPLSMEIMYDPNAIKAMALTAKYQAARYRCGI
jgi:hypothetical protein